ncbi:MAG: hypothetical protein PUF12_04685, partial [Thermoflexaceae bacterium]|nr:hypothetical protein [Thermoflexaceae bacterium]
GVMFGHGVSGFGEYAKFYLWNLRYLLLIGIIGSYPVIGALKKSRINQNVIAVLETVLLICILLISISYLVRGAYNPFVYFNF